VLLTVGRPNLRDYLAPKVLSELGFPLKAETVVDRYLGWSPSRLLQEVEKAGHKVPADAAIRLSQRRKKHISFHNPQAVEGVRKALEMLRAAGVKLCASSVWGVEEMEETLRSHGLENSFDAMCCLSVDEKEGSSPPGPGLHLKCARSLGVSPEQCVVIDDSVAGIEGGIAAGCKAIGFMGGSHLGDGWVDR
jgi:HAD superfamily hydrolase (TIGR01509 family)